MKLAAEDIADRLGMLNVRYAVAFCTIATPDDPKYRELAESLETALVRQDPEAVSRVRALVDHAELGKAAFWATPLGILLFYAGGFTSEEMPQTLAASLLGCSRQYVSELVKKGKLPTSRYGVRGGMVQSEAVRQLLIHKLDKTGK
jgi:excisionase family DNA binding protein